MVCSFRSKGWVYLRRKTLLEFRAKEESMPRTLRPPRAQIRREFAFSAMIRKFALPSAPHGKPCDVNQRFKKRRFPRPVLAHQKRDRCRDAQVEILHKWKRKRELVPFSILRYLASDICQIYLYVSHWLLDLVIGNTFTLATLSCARIDCTSWSKGGRQELLAVAAEMTANAVLKRLGRFVHVHARTIWGDDEMDGPDDVVGRDSGVRAPVIRPRCRKSRTMVGEPLSAGHRRRHRADGQYPTYQRRRQAMRAGYA